MLVHCKKRNEQNIRCTIDILGEDVNLKNEVEQRMESYTNYAAQIYAEKIDASLAIKLSAFGGLLDPDFCKIKVSEIFNKLSNEFNINLEIDMEGTPLIDNTIDTALKCAAQRIPVTLALQAYLDRTVTDLKNLIDNGIKVRLVKGAYFGDTFNFVEIQSRFRKLVTVLSESDVEFCVGTHDPELIEWVRRELIKKSDKFEFGLLKGLGDKTKHLLVNEGWKVSEYVPFGMEISAYQMRRERYLKELNELGRLPVP
jgi:proline dehydrogenase